MHYKWNLQERISWWGFQPVGVLTHDISTYQLQAFEESGTLLPMWIECSTCQFTLLFPNEEGKITMCFCNLPRENMGIVMAQTPRREKWSSFLQVFIKWINSHMFHSHSLEVYICTCHGMKSLTKECLNHLKKRSALIKECRIVWSNYQWDHWGRQIQPTLTSTLGFIILKEHET